MPNEEKQQVETPQNEILNNEILNELKKTNENSHKLFSLIKAQEEDRLKDKETQATKDSEEEAKTSESLEAEQKKQETDLQREEKQHEELMKELKLSNEQLKALAEATANSDLLDEVKDTNKKVATIAENQNVSVAHEANQVSLGSMAVAAIIIAIGGYALLKLGGFFASKITHMLW